MYLEVLSCLAACADSALHMVGITDPWNYGLPWVGRDLQGSYVPPLLTQIHLAIHQDPQVPSHGFSSASHSQPVPYCVFIHI